MSLTKTIPTWMRDELASQEFMKSCCLCGENDIKIDWHHNLTYGGERQNNLWSILPVCIICHRKAENREVKEMLDYQMLKRASKFDLENYPKIDWKQKKKYLEGKFGKLSTVQK